MKNDRVETHVPCELCGSSDAASVYDQGDGTFNKYCHSCDETQVNYYGTKVNQSLPEDLLEVEYRQLKKRHISLETCQRYGYGVNEAQMVQVAPYRDQKGHIVAQKLRTPQKDFRWLGKHKNIQLFGQHLWNQGKKVFICEGEIDTLSVAEVLPTWAVVGIPDGATGTRAVKDNLEWLEGFKEVICVFDNDDAGRKGVEAVAGLLTPGKVKYVKWQGWKDANECLVQGSSKELRETVMYRTETYRPDGIISGSELTLADLMDADDIVSYNLSTFLGLQDKLKGIRQGELTVVAAGSGLGKSTLAKELGYDLLNTNPDLRLGVMALEENTKKTALSFIAIDNNVHFGDLWVDRGHLSPEQYQSTYQKYFQTERIWLYDHFGSLESEALLSKLRYMAVGCGVDVIILDHISIVVSGQEDNGNERKAIDKLMTDLRSLIEQTGVSVIAISHVKNPSQGKQHEEGRQVSLSDLRGSGSIKQLADNVLALVRDMQENTSVLWILKDRLMADVGPCENLVYDRDIGRLLPRGGEFDD